MTMANNTLTASVVIPTLNAMPYLPRLLTALRSQQPGAPLEIVIVDSGSTDGTQEYLKADPTVRLIDIARFSHGGSRNLGVRHATGACIVFLSQDALPRDDQWLANLLAPLQGGDVVAAFSRQVPRPDASPMERYFLGTHFPEAPAVYARRPDHADLQFLQDVFFSNVSSAARRDVLLRHPFDETLIMSEDQQFARDVLQAGHQVAYAAASVVLHSHNYSWMQTLRRYFDSAYSLTQIFKGHGLGSSARLGTGYLRHECGMMLRRHPLQLPRYAAFVLAKTLGTVLGHFAEKLPRRLVRKISMHASYWSAAVCMTLLACSLLGGGCASLFPPAKPLEVGDSQLNWLTIRYRPLSTQRPACRIEIVGAGYLYFIQGKSPLVADDFAVDTEHAQWTNLRQEKLGMTPAETRSLLQRFADAGLTTEPARPGKTLPTAPGIASFRWRINNKSGACFTANPALIALVEEIAERVTRDR
jgi:rhamnosyltransferase